MEAHWQGFNGFILKIKAKAGWSKAKAIDININEAFNAKVK
jgi:hypothetical protein